MPGKEHWLDTPLHEPAHSAVPAQAPRAPCGVWPAGMGQQVPRWFVTSQASQVPPHGRLQQRRSMQAALWQSPSAAQPTPIGRAAVHAPAWQ